MTPPTSAAHLVTLSMADGVALVTFDRPARQNGWTPEMSERYAAALTDAATDTAVRVIVVTGAGGHFCVGGDGAILSDAADSGAAFATAGRPPPWLALAVAKPVIAAIPGVCFGIGLFHALCCDIRFAAADAKFSTAYARRGLVAEMGLSWLLPRAIGSGRAADLLLSARTVRAEEAERIGLVSRVVPTADLLDETMAYARAMAAQTSPRSLAVIKRQLATDRIGGFMPAFARAGILLDAATAAPDFAEGVRSWQAGRAPSFAPPDSAAAWIDLE